jgi:hypothetical protein
VTEAPVYRPAPTLRRFMRSNAFVRAVVGPVGSGKSSACVMEILRRAFEQSPGPDGVRRSRWAVIRNTYPQLRDTTRKTFEQWIPPEVGQWREQEFAFVIDRKMDDGTRISAEVLFRALDRPEDVKKLLSLELTGAYLNEAREIPKRVVDVLQSRVGRYPSKARGGPTWFGVWMDTNPWHTGHWGYQLFTEGLPDGFELFEQPGGREPAAENTENLPPGYYARLCQGKDAEWVGEYVDSRYPASDRGSVYGHLIQAIKARGGIAEFEHARDGVFVNFDLGISDSTAMWFWRLGKGIDIVDHYEAHGEPLSHFFGVLDAKGYDYVKLWLPHDARARTLQTGVSTLDQFLGRYGAGKVAIAPELSLADGLMAARWLLEQPSTRFHARCSATSGPSDIDGLDALRSYKYEYDEERKVYRRAPLHDWSSHSADAFRYLALVVKHSEMLMREPVEAPRPPPTVDDLFRQHMEARANG